MKRFFQRLAPIVYIKTEFTLQKIMIILAVIVTFVEIAFGRVHNLAAYKVASTVSIYTFMTQIFLILTAVSIMRLSEKKRYLILAYLLLALSLTTMIVYIVLMLNDVYYLNAINGQYPYVDAVKIIYSIEDSVNITIIAIIINVIIVLLLTVEFFIRRRRYHGLSSEG